MLPGRGAAATLFAAMLAGAAAMAGCAPVAATGAAPASASAARVLVFTRTTGFRHDSIPVAVATLRELGADAGLIVDHGADPRAFSAANLARYRAVVFASTTGDVLDAGQQAALEAFIRDGGGFLGLHAAADTEYDWPWYGELVGAWFDSHPPGLQTARVRFADASMLAGAATGSDWRVTDELYNYRRNPRPWVRVVATLETGDYAGSTMGADHPIAWCRPFDGGRSWYTGLGHDARVYDDPVFRRHLARGLRYVTGAGDAC